MQKIYNYDKDGFYVGEGYASPNPRVEGEYLLPANSTIIEIPSLSETQKARFNKIKNKWEIYTITATTKNFIIDDELKVIRDMNLEEQIDKGIVSLLETQKLNDDKTEIINKTYSELIADNVKTLDEIKTELIKELSDKVNFYMNRGKEFIINGEKKYHKARTEDSIASQVVIERAIANGVDTVEGYRLFDENGNSSWTTLTITEIQDIVKQCQDWVIFTLYTQRARIENEIANLTIENIDTYEVIINETI